MGCDLVSSFAGPPESTGRKKKSRVFVQRVVGGKGCVRGTPESLGLSRDPSASARDATYRHLWALQDGDRFSPGTAQLGQHPALSHSVLP